MVDYREILRLDSLKYSQRMIESSAGSSRHTINAVLTAAKNAGIAWPLDENVTNAMLQATFFPGKYASTSKYAEPDYSTIHRELARPGVTLTLLWAEYCRKARDSQGCPYMYTQFCEKYRQWARLTKATMRVQHKPGESMQVDWAGNTIPVYDPVTGDESKAYLFVAVLPCSCYAYIEACPDMKTESWLLCHAQAYRYFGGITRLLIPDNLRTGVTANTRYDTVLNRSYQEMAEHYHTAIVPARVRHPQDKSLAESTVRFASTWIIAALRNRKFFSVGEVQQAVAERLEALNSAPFKKRQGSRREAYLSEEQEFMKPLPTAPYEPAIWTVAKVGNDYLVSDGLNKYSLPYDLIGEEVSVRLTRNTVEVFFNGSRVALHLRKATAQRDPVVNPEHMTPEHRKYLNYNAEDFMSWAEAVGRNASAVVRHFLTSGKEAEQGYKACASLTRLTGRYGARRLEAACARVLEITATPTIRSISTLLKTMRDDKTTSTPSVEESNRYGITRGASYFGKGGARND
jgi:transposase